MLVWGSIVFLVALFVLGFAFPAQAATEFVYVRAPRTGGNTAVSLMPDVTNPLALPPGSHLMRVQQGAETILVNAGAAGAIFDPVVRPDGLAVAFSHCPNVAALNPTYALPLAGCDIKEIVLATGAIRTLVDSQRTWSPLSGYANWSAKPDRADPAGTAHAGHGVFNMGPAYVPSEHGGYDLLFTSNMNNPDTLKRDGATNIFFQLFRLRQGHISQVWYGSQAVLHPVMVHNGKICWTTLENSQNRDGRNWGIWCADPDGTDWMPTWSATMHPFDVPHFLTGTKDGGIVSAVYYPFFNHGLGNLLKWPFPGAGTNLRAPFFGSPVRRNNPIIAQGVFAKQYSFTPVGLHPLTPQLSPEDVPMPLGKIGHPHQAKDGLLVSYTSNPGKKGFPPEANPSIFLLPGGFPTTDIANDLVALLPVDPAWNRLFPREVAPWQAIYGTPAVVIPDHRNDGTQTPELPAGTPFGIVQFPSVCDNEYEAGQSAAGWRGQSALFGGDEVSQNTNQDSQGATTRAGIVCNDLGAIAIIAQGHVPKMAAGDPAAGVHTNTFSAANDESRHVLGWLPLPHRNAAGLPILDTSGKPDTSGKMKIPANTPFIFEVWAANTTPTPGAVLVTGGTSHMIRPGETIMSCTAGCHVHSKDPLVSFVTTTAATKPATPALQIVPGMSPEWKAQVRPIIQSKCVSCHTAAAPAGGIDLQTETLVEGGLPRSAAIFSRNSDSRYGGPASPVFGRYPAPMTGPFAFTYSALRSPLVWLLYGQRLDGFTNNDFLSVPPFPPGTNSTQIDIDFRDAVRLAHQGLGMSDTERWTILRWIDVGLPVNTDASPRQRGWGTDVWSPVIAWGEEPGTPPSPQCPCPIPGGRLLFGLHDVGSGLNLSTLTVQRDGAIITPESLGDGRYAVPRTQGTYAVTVRDNQGNTKSDWRVVP